MRVPVKEVNPDEPGKSEVGNGGSMSRVVSPGV